MFRDITDRFVFTKAGNNITADTVLDYLGKAIPLCPYSGDTINVAKAPVDFNAQNILPSNMSWVSKTLFKKDGNMIMASVDHEDYTITLYAPDFIIEKNIALIKSFVFNDADQKIINEKPIEAVYAMWDALMFNNVKGLFEVKLLVNGVTYTAEAQLALGKLASKQKEREKLAPATKIHLG